MASKNKRIIKQAAKKKTLESSLIILLTKILTYFATGKTSKSLHSKQR